MDDILLKSALSIITILFAGNCYFFKRLVSQFDAVTKQSLGFIEKISGIEVTLGNLITMSDAMDEMKERFGGSLSSIKTQFELFKKDLETALVAARQIKEIEKSMAVYERNQTTIFKKIDDISTYIEKLSSMISEFRRKVI